jgi:hypothetical protein
MTGNSGKERSRPVKYVGTWRWDGGDGLAHRAADAGRPLRVEQDGPASPAYDLVLHTCNRRQKEQGRE